MEHEINEDRVKILAHDAINNRLEEFVKRVCHPEHSRLERDREERGKKIDELDKSIDTLSKCMNGKFNKLYFLIFGVLASIITTLLVVIFK